MEWLRANGGPLALVVLGVALTGFTTHYGWILVVAGALWWIATYVWRRLPWQLQRKPQHGGGDLAFVESLRPSALGGQPALDEERGIETKRDSNQLPAIEIRGEVETIHDVFSPHGRILHNNVSVWLYVKNQGRTAEFSVRFWNVQGVPANWGSNYGVRHVSWEGGQPTTRPTIDGYGGERRLKVANVARAPWAFWFWTTENGVEECGNQLLLEEIYRPFVGININFEIEIVNHGTADKLFKRGYIAIIQGSGLPTFTLIDKP